MITENAFSLQIDKIATLWEKANPRERVFFIGEEPTEHGLRKSIVYCPIGSISWLNEDWYLVEPQSLAHGMPRLRRKE